VFVPAGKYMSIRIFCCRHSSFFVSRIFYGCHSHCESIFKEVPLHTANVAFGIILYPATHLHVTRFRKEHYELTKEVVNDSDVEAHKWKMIIGNAQEWAGKINVLFY
jgi:hypothetical protein